MSGFELNDNQRAASTSLGHHVLVAAAAGSGKTRVLAERCANAVIPGEVPGWDPVSPDRLLAITYTEKAAGELAERVRGTLRLAGQREEARLVETAWLSTIHGMCSRILRSAALEAGLDPNFGILDSVQLGIFGERALEGAASSLLDTDPRVRRLFAEYPWDACAEVAVDLHSAASRYGCSPQDFICDGGVEFGSWLAWSEESLLGFIDELKACGVQADSVNEHLEYCVSVIEGLNTLADQQGDDLELAKEAWLLLVSKSLPRTSKGIKELKQTIKAWRAGAIQDVAAILAGDFALALISLAEAYGTELKALKRQSGVLYFDDLQTEALALLRSSSEVTERLRNQFKVVMVDEFQDTDAQQLAIVELLADKDLCTVGDELQSIYRFRGADVSVYREHNRTMLARGAKQVPLATNYRSHPDILGLVNDVFSRPFGDRLVRLEAGRIEPEPPLLDSGACRIELLAAEADCSAGEGRELVADAIAERLHAVHIERGVPLSDMVVLVRSYTSADVYAKALRRRGMEALTVGGTRFLEQREVRVLEALCRCIGNRLDTEALWAVLSSPLCEVSDDGLLELRRSVSGGTAQTLWEAMSQNPLSGDDAGRLSLFVEAMNEASAATGAGSLSEALLRVFERTGWDLRCFAEGAEGRQVYGNVLKLARMADAFSYSSSNDPVAFADHLADKRRFKEKEPPGSLPGDGFEAVRIMSIHSSKGLEFPVVAIPELDANDQSDSGAARLSNCPQPTIAVQLPSTWSKKSEERHSALFSRTCEQLKEQSLEEHLRVYYVGFTRARELLLLGGRFTDSESAMMTVLLAALTGEKDCDGELLTDSGVRVGLTCLAVEEEAPGETQGAEESRVEASPEPSTSQEAWNEALAETPQTLAQAAPAPRRLSYSAIREYIDCPRMYEARRVFGFAGAVGPTSDDSALRFGTAVHTALQLGLEQTDTERLDAMARFHRLDAQQKQRMVTVFSDYRMSDIARLEAQADTVQREAPFAVNVGTQGRESFVLDGSLDLIARTGDDALVIDYKTGSQDKVAELEEKFRLQARCYAFAALRSGAKNVSVIFVRPEVREADGSMQRIVYEFAEKDAGAIEDDLLAVYRDISAARFDPAGPTDAAVCRRCPLGGHCDQEARG
jgi:ATP-dependent helicase/nuclease subunit A